MYSEKISRNYKKNLHDFKNGFIFAENFESKNKSS